MTLAFDTSILISLERGEKEVLRKIEELSKMHKVPAQITFISYYEFLRGIMLRNPKNTNDAIDFIDTFYMVNTTKETAKILAKLRNKYDKLGLSLSLADMLIASQVAENNLFLVTRDKDFEKIEEIEKIII